MNIIDHCFLLFVSCSNDGGSLQIFNGWVHVKSFFLANNRTNCNSFACMPNTLYIIVVITMINCALIIYKYANLKCIIIADY